MSRRKNKVYRTDVFLASVAVFLTLAVPFSGCRRKYAPKPYGYPRIERGSAAYLPFDTAAFPLKFDISSSATVAGLRKNKTSSVWINILYPRYSATLYCTCLPLGRGDAGGERARATELVYLHAAKASSIEAVSYEGENVSATIYRLYGNVATPVQFVADDGENFLLRGAFYFNTEVNPDSVAPVVEYAEEDIRRLVETLELK